MLIVCLKEKNVVGSMYVRIIFSTGDKMIEKKENNFQDDCVKQ